MSLCKNRKRNVEKCRMKQYLAVAKKRDIGAGQPQEELSLPILQGKVHVKLPHFRPFQIISLAKQQVFESENRRTRVKVYAMMCAPL